jgi:steroid delta-isomerase-like uncharacterized protein
MSISENVSIMKRWYREVWREGRNETIYELLSADAVVSGQTGPQAEIHGPAEFADFADTIRKAFPDTDLVVEDAFGDGDKVAVRWTATMTHSGDDLGVPATGKKVSITGISIVRIVNGKIVAGWDNWDRLAMLEQIGAYSPADAVILAKTAK